MADKYLDLNGLAYYDSKLDAELEKKVDKETGKGLSTNDYTSEEKTKLANVEAGAQANVLEGVQIGGASLTPTNKIVNIPVVTGAGAESAGAAGVAPAPAAGDQAKFLRGDGSWQLTPTVDPATADPAMDGTAAVGSSVKYAREDHVHPTDTSRAPLLSPEFSGAPTAPTAAAGTNTTQLATTAFVQAAVQAAISGSAAFHGTVNAGTDISSLTDYKQGWYWVVATAGVYVGQDCEAGDMIFCVEDYSTAYKASDFNVVQTNLSITPITTAEIDALFA